MGATDPQSHTPHVPFCTPHPSTEPCALGAPLCCTAHLGLSLPLDHMPGPHASPKLPSCRFPATLSLRCPRPQAPPALQAVSYHCALSPGVGKASWREKEPGDIGCFCKRSSRESSGWVGVWGLWFNLSQAAGDPWATSLRPCSIRTDLTQSSL